LGARLPDGTAAGSIGDLSVYSFNPTKILECGGGALLLRSPKLVSICTALAESDPLPPEIDEAQARTLGLSYRNLHHSLVALLRSRAVDEVSSAFLKLQPAFRPIYLRRIKDPAALAGAWPQLQQVLDHRNRNAQHYDEILADGNWERISQWRQSGVCWRYSLLVKFPENLVDFSEAVRRDGFHVSNLYWPVNDFFRPGDACPNADDFARRIVNLWVDQTVDRQWVEKCATSLLRNAARFAA
jgi:dTDP-4-amino-4,6-dideoxygalactose transaminase